MALLEGDRPLTTRRIRLGALAGMVGPLVFTATFTVEGLLREGYDPRRMFVSALSLGPRGWIQIVNFLVLGATVFAFSRGVAAALPDGKASRAGPMLLSIIAVCLFGSGPFVMDPMGTVREQMTTHGIVHGILGAIFFTLAPVTCFVFWRRFRTDEGWRSFRAGTLLAGIGITIAVVLQRIATPPPPAPSNALTSFSGLLQRTALITFLAWVFMFARALYSPVSRALR